MKVYVFKTSVSHSDLDSVERIIDTLIPHTQWNFDFDDCDNILRVVSKRDISEVVCTGLAKFGYLCQEL